MKMRVQVDGQVYEVEIGDLNSRPIQAVVGSELFVVWPEEALEPAVAAATATTAPLRVSAPAPITVAPSGEAEIIAAPLPGDVVAVAVKMGDAVTAGQLLCTVESMKMNNPVRSPRPGVVAEVLVAVGDHVNHGQPLVRLS
jgi:biotin carboxyl carrier protein